MIGWVSFAIRDVNPEHSGVPRVSSIGVRFFVAVPWTLAAVCLVSVAGCSDGFGSSGTKKDEGGPIPPHKIVEEPEKPMKMPPRATRRR